MAYSRLVALKQHGSGSTLQAADTHNEAIIKRGYGQE
jgi:hypothetical protein